VGMVSTHVNHNKVGPAARGTMPKSQVHFSHSIFGLKFCFYLDELGSHNRYAPLTHNADNRAPSIRFHRFSYSLISCLLRVNHSDLARCDRTTCVGLSL
jgi:hypothetical protein